MARKPTKPIEQTPLPVWMDLNTKDEMRLIIRRYAELIHEAAWKDDREMIMDIERYSSRMLDFLKRLKTPIGRTG